MKQLFYLFLFIVFSHYCNAQKEANMWYFGNRAGINFNSGVPVPFSGSAMNILEGCASIADTNGTTLFYTNGLQVWNKNNLQMPNGSGLMGNDNSAQSAIIVRAPGSYTLFYIFTTPTNGNAAMRYTVVDMTLQSGLGDVTTKNSFLFNNSTEKVTAVRHANGTDIWVIGHEFNSNKFYSFLVTTTGVNLTPVITSVGSVHTGFLSFAGYMKASHNGKKLAYAITIPQNIVELFDFDNITGVPGNPITFTNITEAYGLEFSPDDSKLYVTEENPQYIVQWDLSLGSAAAIKASQINVASGNGSGFAALQLAPDGKIYLAKRMNISTLGVINNPNNAGLACNFVNNAVTLVGGTSQYGLPNFFQSFLGAPAIPPPVASFLANDTVLCENDCINFTDLSANATSWLWTFAGAAPATSTDKHPQGVCYFSSGSYHVTLTATNAGGSNTITLNSYIDVAAAPPTPGITLSGNTLFCSTDPTYTSYQWYDDTTLVQAATDSSFVISHSGNYNVQVKNGSGCAIAVGINVVLGIKPLTVYNLHFTVSPNPVTDELKIHGEGMKEGYNISIFNVMGEKIYMNTLNSKQETINCKQFPAGIYFVRIQSGGVEWVGRFIKQ